MWAIVVTGVIGCGAPKMFSPDAAVYQSGTLWAMSSKDMDAVYNATLKAMEKLELQVSEKMKDVFAAKVIAKSADNKVISVQIKPAEGQKTQYSIKVGTLGNEERSRKIYNEIAAALGMPMGK